MAVTQNLTFSRQNCMLASRGFTLIELMIAVAIVAIIAAIAIPSYSSYILSSRRTDGQASLQRILLEQEKWRSNNPSYTATLSDLGVSGTSADGHYTIAIREASGTGYTATAEARGNQRRDTSCTPMSLVLTNGVTVTTTPAGCWKK